MTKAARQILETAGQLFSDRGYERVGINEIIAKSGVAKATFYTHFKSKEILCATWLTEAANVARRARENLLASEVTATEKLSTAFDTCRAYIEGSDYRGCPFCVTASMVDPSSKVRAIISGFAEDSRHFWRALAGEFGLGGQDAAQTGDTFSLLYSGAVAEAQNTRATWPVEAAKRSALKLASQTPTKT